MHVHGVRVKEGIRGAAAADASTTVVPGGGTVRSLSGEKHRSHEHVVIIPRLVRGTMLRLN
jgi:hypothetical protein